MCVSARPCAGEQAPYQTCILSIEQNLHFHETVTGKALNVITEVYILTFVVVPIARGVAVLDPCGMEWNMC